MKPISKMRLLTVSLMVGCLALGGCGLKRNLTLDDKHKKDDQANSSTPATDNSGTANTVPAAPAADSSVVPQPAAPAKTAPADPANGS